VELLTHDDLVEVHVLNRLLRTDYDSIVPVLMELAGRFGKLRYLVFLDNFQGWEPSAMWRELKFDAQHRDTVGKVAVIGASLMQRLTAEAARIYLSGPVEFFPRDQEAKARAWIES
jgi:hypothetical protein